MSWPFFPLSGVNVIVPANQCAFVARKYVIGLGDKLFIDTGAILRIT